MRSSSLPLTLLIAATLVGCTLLYPVRGPVVPRPNQRQWLDEPAVVNLVTRYVYECRFDSRRNTAERQYAARLRHWYSFASSGGLDADGGRRAVNFVHRIHLDAKGSRSLWKRVLSLARQPAPGQDGLALPAEVE
jgi:hypothetical protein